MTRGYPEGTTQNYLPWTHLTLDDARAKLAGWHFAKEALSDSEREILYVAEAVLRELDRRTETE